MNAQPPPDAPDVNTLEENPEKIIQLFNGL